MPTAKNTITLIDQVAKARGVTVTPGKVEELRDIMAYGKLTGRLLGVNPA